jgi:hypothetical protein
MVAGRSASIAVRVRLGALLVVASIVGCRSRFVPPPLADRSAETPDVRLFLIGDAGAEERNAVLDHLQGAIARDPERSLTLFLGDNVYPAGIPDSLDPTRARSERRLRVQMNAVKEGGGRGIFLAGNHDWGTSEVSDARVLERQAAIIATAAPQLQVLPTPGCPGPSVLDVGRTVRVVLIDTEWFIRMPPRRPALSNCLTSETKVLDSLRIAIASAGSRRVVVAGHHPLVSVGPHGGRFGWTHHVFTLRELWRPLWVPLPGIGSLYPLARRVWTSPDDLRSARYSRFRFALDSVFRMRPPLAYAAGHDHNLQVLRDSSAGVLLVSGGGSRNRAGSIAPYRGTLFARRGRGFMELTVYGDGHAELSVVTVNGNDVPCTCFRMQVN